MTVDTRHASSHSRLLIVSASADTHTRIAELMRDDPALITHAAWDDRALADVLERERWDMAIAADDDATTDLHARAAMIARRAPDLPLLVWLHNAHPDVAASMLALGARDVIATSDHPRFVHAVRRELAAATTRRRLHRAEQALARAEQQLRQAQRMESIGRLAGGLAHDFNNLLTVILGYGDMLRERLAEDAMLREGIDQIRGAGERASALTRRLLAYSRRQTVEARVTDLNALVGNVEKLLRRMLGTDIDFRTHLDPAIAFVRVDPGLTEQVLMNLAANARDAMPEGGRLEIRTCERLFAEHEQVQGVAVPHGRYVWLSVSDTGVGMPADIVPHVFEPFFTTKSVGHGTGLGLSMAYDTVKAAGGYIFVESRVGGGTTFDIYLPVVDTMADTPSVAHPDAHGLDGSETVLLVDDDEPVRTVLSRALSEHGYHVLTAENGMDALAVAETYSAPIHLLVADLVMPRKGGAELGAQLTAHQPSLPVLYISGWTDRYDGQQDDHRAPRAYLTKPFTAVALVRTVRHLLDASAQQGDPAGPWRKAPAPGP